MPETDRPYLPIAIGFYLLAVPLVVSVFLAERPAGAWTNAIAGLVMVALGFALQRRTA